MAKEKDEILDEILEEEETTDSMSEEELRGIISSEIQKALKSMDFSKATKCTTITSGTLDEKISRSVKDAVNDAVKKQMEDYRKDVESSTLPPPPTQMVPVYDMTQSKPKRKGLFGALIDAAEEHPIVTLGVGATIGATVLKVVSSCLTGNDANIFDGDMPD